MKPIRKAVIPAAGFGTRFLPATKSLPKEMLPIVDKPVIQYIVQEAVASGIEEFVLITGSNKRAIEDHFDYNFELEYQLQSAGREDCLTWCGRSPIWRSSLRRQKDNSATGTPCCARAPSSRRTTVVVLWGDDFIDAKPPRVQQLVDTHNRHKASVLSVIRTSNPEDTLRYGFVDGDEVEPGLFKVNRIVEKPGPEHAPSDIAVVSGFVLGPEIFQALDEVRPGAGGEIWLTDAVNHLLRTHDVYAKVIENGRYYDCGNKLEYLKANIDFGLRRPDLGPGLMSYLEQIVDAHRNKS